ncbi:MAG: hypothetical protein ACKO16_09350 [Gemmataceae bacterium]
MNITQVWKRSSGAGGRDISWNDILIREPSDVYHAQANKYLSSHRLSAFRECPLLYRSWQLGEVVDEDRPPCVLGRPAHSLILEGLKVFQDQYVVGGPINPRTGLPFEATTKAFAEWAPQIDKEVLSEAQARIAKEMNDSVFKDVLYLLPLLFLPIRLLVSAVGI